MVRRSETDYHRLARIGRLRASGSAVRRTDDVTRRHEPIGSGGFCGEPHENLARAEAWVVEAARRGAELVVGPELLAPGYVYDARLWRAGEARGGATERWLARLAKTHAIHLGAGYLETDGDDFYNTFALAGPSGEIVGRVRKESRPGFESWFFRGSDEPKVLDTELGRIAIGICQDNHTARFYRRLMREGADLLLMPHSAPCPRDGADLVRASLREIAPFYARIRDPGRPREQGRRTHRDDDASMRTTRIASRPHAPSERRRHERTAGPMTGRASRLAFGARSPSESSVERRGLDTTFARREIASTRAHGPCVSLVRIPTTDEPRSRSVRNRGIDQREPTEGEPLVA